MVVWERAPRPFRPSKARHIFRDRKKTQQKQKPRLNGAFIELSCRNQMGTLAKQLQPMTRPTKCQDTKGMAFIPSKRPRLANRQTHPGSSEASLPRDGLYSCPPRLSGRAKLNRGFREGQKGARTVTSGSSSPLHPAFPSPAALKCHPWASPSLHPSINFPKHRKPARTRAPE